MCAWASPNSVSTESFELPWILPSAFQVLWPCRTRTTRLDAFTEGSGRGGTSLRSSRREKSSVHGELATPTPAMHKCLDSLRFSERQLRSDPLPRPTLGRKERVEQCCTPVFVGARQRGDNMTGSAGPLHRSVALSAPSCCYVVSDSTAEIEKTVVL